MAGITVVFFAHLRESLGLPELKVDLSELRSQDTDGLVAYLAREYREFKEYTESAAVLVAINQTLMNDNSIIKDGDVVAMFPPVTGG